MRSQILLMKNRLPSLSEMYQVGPGENHSLYSLIEDSSSFKRLQIHGQMWWLAWLAPSRARRLRLGNAAYQLVNFLARAMPVYHDSTSQ